MALLYNRFSFSTDVGSRCRLHSSAPGSSKSGTQTPVMYPRMREGPQGRRLYDGQHERDEGLG